jgi:hypothetical protein
VLLPQAEAVAELCETYGIVAEAALLKRASGSFWERELRISQGEHPPLEVHLLDDWQAAEAIWIAAGHQLPVMKWPWRKLATLVGDLLAGEVWIAGAKTGDGKSTFIANLLLALILWQEWFRVTVATLEQSPAVFKTKLACLSLGYDIPAVFRNEWWALGVDETLGRSRLREAIVAQGRTNVRFCPHDVMDRKGLREVIEQAHEWHHRLVIIDHIHHMDHGDGPENRGIRETMRLAKTLAKRYDMGILFTAQLNRGDTRDRRRKFYPPELSDLMGASAIEQVADGVLLLYRPLEAGIKVGDIDDVIMGQREWKSVFQPNTIAVRCAKHRLDGDQRNKDALLHFERARITDDQTVATERGDAYGA